MEPIDEPIRSVSVDNVHVRFDVYEDQRPAIVDLARRGFRSRISTTVHALRGIDLSIDVGEAVGIVGRNGSGKSTLLRSIAGVQPIESGRVLVRGEARLLGVRAALEPRLSGWRNIYLGGLAMGLTRGEVEARFDEVKTFSGLDTELARPIQTYSSGMRARLAFAIATMSVPDVLLIDEALAVGDRRFKKRSLAKVRSVCEAANTVIMVTHNLDEIRATCARTVWMHDGEVVADGPTDEVLRSYVNADDATA